MNIKIGNRNYITEDEPLSIFKIHEKNIIVIWGNELYLFEYNWETGYQGNPKQKTYACCKISNLRNSNIWHHTNPRELYKIIKTDSRKLQKEFNIKPICFH